MSTDGGFNFKATHEEVRTQRNTSLLHSVIWHNNVPRKMSFLVWRLMNKWLPVDETLARKGIHLASKCTCCSHIETLEHIFFSNPIADELWKHFAGLIGIRYATFQNVNEALTTWSLSATPGHIRQVAPIVILWSLWEARNKKKHLNVTYSYHSGQHTGDSY
ncbi:hypothetical protein LIER_34771 [Lithospermum erythrorhizon]|uniref:Reverse transcriptase zinc-binding domain-containing protein n=1 Tax=Lithospermum erythrorhizon TaxID=34254 RepID=A0AAV3S0K7_LITER